MKVEKVIKMYESFSRLSEKELPFPTAFAVAENMEILKTAYEVANKKRNEIINNAVERDSDGKPVKLDDEMYKLKKGSNAHEELESLLCEEVSIDSMKKLSKDGLKEIRVEPAVLQSIREYIE